MQEKGAPFSCCFSQRNFDEGSLWVSRHYRETWQVCKSLLLTPDKNIIIDDWRQLFPLCTIGWMIRAVKYFLYQHSQLKTLAWSLKRRKHLLISAASIWLISQGSPIWASIWFLSDLKIWALSALRFADATVIKQCCRCCRGQSGSKSWLGFKVKWAYWLSSTIMRKSAINSPKSGGEGLKSVSIL